MEIPEIDHPGVYNYQADEILGVDTGSEMPLEPNVNVGADFESPVPQEMPLVDTSSTEQPPVISWLISVIVNARCWGFYGRFVVSAEREWRIGAFTQCIFY